MAETAPRIVDVPVATTASTPSGCRAKHRTSWSALAGVTDGRSWCWWTCGASTTSPGAAAAICPALAAGGTPGRDHRDPRAVAPHHRAARLPNREAGTGHPRPRGTAGVPRHHRGGPHAWQAILAGVYARYEREMPRATRPEPGDLVITSGRSCMPCLRAAHPAPLLRLRHQLVPHRSRLRHHGDERARHNIILVRDATTIECHDTVEDLWATRMTIREIETSGWSTTTGRSSHCGADGGPLAP